MSINNKNISRRELFKVAGTTGLAALLGRGWLPAARAEEAAASADNAMPQVPRRVLGKTGAEIPILVMGGGQGFDERFDPRLAECMRFGVNYFDVADCYAGGKSETGLGAFIEKTGKRKDIWITTKSDNHSPDGLEKILERSLERLKTDHVELMFMHALKDESKLNDDMMRKAEALKKAGKIQFFGFSCHDGNVAELLEKAAAIGWIDAIMFKYNFRAYGDEKLNKAIDACHKAHIGLIAMKTQGSAVSFEDRVKKFHGDKFSKPQAVLKAVWEDDRITAAVSHMDTLEKIKENTAAALDKSSLTLRDHRELQEYAAATQHLYCAGCEHICNQAVPHGVQVGTTLRYLMYHDSYGDRQTARELFAHLPASAQRIKEVDYTQASALCPHKIDIAKHMHRAADVLA